MIQTEKLEKCWYYILICENNEKTIMEYGLYFHRLELDSLFRKALLALMESYAKFCAWKVMCHGVNKICLCLFVCHETRMLFISLDTVVTRELMDDAFAKRDSTCRNICLTDTIIIFQMKV